MNKRANKLYGLADSEEKQRWIKEEFEKRRLKRMEKERRKHIVNNVLSVPSPTSTGSPATTTNDMLPGAAPQLSAYYSPLPQIDNATASKLLDFPADLQRQLLEQLNNSMLVSRQIYDIVQTFISYYNRHLQMAFRVAIQLNQNQTTTIIMIMIIATMIRMKTSLHQ